MSLRKEKSCGCIIIDNNKVLLVYQKFGKFWGFPKGHVEEGENEIETAVREVKEEVGLDVIIDEEKRYAINYIVRNEIDKTSVFFIATPKDNTITKQESEIEDIKWCDFDEAMDLITYDDLKYIFKKAIKDIK